jgi:hypothetical protein
LAKEKVVVVDRSLRIPLKHDMVWDALARRMGISKSAAMIAAIRDAAAARGIDLDAIDAQADEAEEE